MAVTPGKGWLWLASAVGGPLAITGTNFGFDFNTVADAIRVVSNDNSNYVVNADTGTVGTVATPVFYGPGDVNEGATPRVAGNAYIHGTTTQYAIGANLDVLVRQANNAGTLTTVGSLGVPVGPRTSFDIGFDGIAYLLDTDRLYTVNLDTGLATFTGNTSNALFGITALDVGAVPEPATWAMMILGFGLVGGAMRRRKTAHTVKLSYS